MRSVMLCVVSTLAGCAVHSLPDYDSFAVNQICSAPDNSQVTVTLDDVSNSLHVRRIDTWEELYRYCGNADGACMDKASNTLYLLNDRRCAQHAVHELGHLYDIPGTDTLRDIERRRNEFEGFHHPTDSHSCYAGLACDTPASVANRTTSQTEIAGR